MNILSRQILIAFASGICLLTGPTSVKAQPDASYTVTFEASWSALSHPDEFPASAHFSGLVGGTHDSTVTFWSPDSLATPGIRRMAELGAKSSLTSEVESAITNQTAEFVLSGGGIGRSPGSVSLALTLSARYPLVTLVSMLAPSPDWFVGVSGVSLLNGTQWLDTLTIPLSVYDAGTDSGPRYTSPNQATSPPQAIRALQEGPFAANSTVGKFRFERSSATSSERPETMSRAVSGIFPNPTTGDARIVIHAAKPQNLNLGLVDLLGRTVWQDYRQVSGGGRLTVDLPTGSLPAGMYVMRVWSLETLTTRSIVVIR